MRWIFHSIFFFQCYRRVISASWWELVFFLFLHVRAPPAGLIVKHDFRRLPSPLSISWWKVSELCYKNSLGLMLRSNEYCQPAWKFVDSSEMFSTPVSAPSVSLPSAPFCRFDNSAEMAFRRHCTDVTQWCVCGSLRFSRKAYEEADWNRTGNERQENDVTQLSAVIGGHDVCLLGR